MDSIPNEFCLITRSVKKHCKDQISRPTNDEFTSVISDRPIFVEIPCNKSNSTMRRNMPNMLKSEYRSVNIPFAFPFLLPKQQRLHNRMWCRLQPIHFRGWVLENRVSSPPILIDYWCCVNDHRTYVKCHLCTSHKKQTWARREMLNYVFESLQRAGCCLVGLLHCFSCVINANELVLCSHVSSQFKSWR